MNHILNVFESQGYIQLEKFGGERISVYSVSVKLRRAFGAGQVDA
jgi:ABC-type transporter Mla maintaining outer membrane lipid asymmetry permease subunit MlaE